MNTVLFDLDGTLLPIEEEPFTKVYFKELSRKLIPDGFDPSQLVSMVWAGTKCMMKNDGQRPNIDVFWAEFARLSGRKDVESIRAKCDDFYSNEFHAAKVVVGDAPHSASVVRRLRQKGYKLALATNPVFPLVGVSTRLAWIGLNPSDFDHITTYENSRFCKPNPGYYGDILAALGVSPQDCLMVGNHATEDMCFSALGGQVYLVTDHLIHEGGEDISGHPKGSMADFVRIVEALPTLT